MSDKDEWDFLIEEGWSVVIDRWAIYWYHHGNVHNFRDLPAIEFINGEGPKMWYNHGKDQDVYYPWESPSRLEEILERRRVEKNQ